MKALLHPLSGLNVIALCALLLGCGSLPSETVVAPSYNGSRGAAVVRAARQQIGVPYRYGGDTPRGFDCSGLVHYAYERAGIEVPRTTAGLLRRAHRVSLAQLRPGDVLFFRVAPPKISHVGLYIGNGRFVHAPSSGEQVSYANLSNQYWRQHFVSAGRFY